MNLKLFVIGLSLIAGLSMTLPSCKSEAEKDTEAKAKIEATLTGDVTVDVKDGVATLSGTFPDEASRTATAEAAKSTPGIKSVVDNSTVDAPAPVIISGDDALTTGVNTAVAAFSGVSAQVQDGIVTLTGSIAKSDLQTLMQAINALQPKKVENKLTVQ